MSSGMRAKIAAGVKGREQTPFIAWLRRKLLLVRRTDGRDEYMNHLRHANDQAARDQPPPEIPGGPHHKINANLYLERDARRTMQPAAILMDSESQKMLTAATTPEKPIALGPKENFGLPTPVPGVGYIWKRSVQDEPLHTQRDKVFKSLERYDGYK